MSLALEKAINLLNLVAGGNTSLGALAKISGQSRSTTHRLLATLVDANLLHLEDREYSLGNRIFELGEIKRRSMSFLDSARPIMLRYAETTGDTIHLAVLDGQEIMLLERCFGNRQLRINSYPGLRNRAIMTAVGKALIAHQVPLDGWRDMVSNLPPDYSKTAEQILADLHNARKTNTAIDFNECNLGTCGIASTFATADGKRLACSINGATVYFPETRMLELRPVVHQLAQDLSEALAQQSASDMQPRSL